MQGEEKTISCFQLILGQNNTIGLFHEFIIFWWNLRRPQRNQNSMKEDSGEVTSRPHKRKLHAEEKYMVVCAGSWFSGTMLARILKIPVSGEFVILKIVFSNGISNAQVQFSALSFLKS